MITRLACFARLAAPYALVVAMAFLAAGTISNQIRINQANSQLRQQAENGQRSLTRACRLVPAGIRIYKDSLRRHVITPEQFAIYLDATRQACPHVPLPER